MTILPSGLEMKQPTNLMKRQVRKYWRQVDVMDATRKIISRTWNQTELLPSDTESQAAYLAKGFRLDNPLEGQGIPLSNTSSENKDGIISTLEDAVKSKDDEIAKLREELAKGKEDSPRKVGRPKIV